MGWRWKSMVAAALVAVLVVVSSTEAQAAGVTTHAWMGLEAIEVVTTPELKALLDAHRGQVEGGAQYPDSGYINATLNVPGGLYGEEAHWQRFFDAYADRIRANPACGDLTAPDGPCAGEIAHLMGMAAHGMGDEVWDWLFEPTAPDHGEELLPPELSPIVGPGGIEFQMDMIAIAVHGRPTSPDTPGLPNVDDLQAAFAAAGRPDITNSGLLQGKTNMGVIRNAEGSLAATYAPQVLTAMPWTSANMITAPGGVTYASVAIAGLYETLWGRLLGAQPTTKVSITYPANGQLDMPATGWERSFYPGSYSDRGGARNRIAAALSYSLPYVASAADTTTHIPAQLPAGAMTLRVGDDGPFVPIMDGYPKQVPYNPDYGEHEVDIQPAADLEPCTTYRVDVTDKLIDAAGRPVVPMHWSFRTEGCVDTTTVPTTAASSPSSTSSTTVDPSSSTTAVLDPSPARVAAATAAPVQAVPRFTG